MHGSRHLAADPPLRRVLWQQSGWRGNRWAIIAQMRGDMRNKGLVLLLLTSLPLSCRLMKPWRSRTQTLPRNSVFLPLSFIALVRSNLVLFPLYRCIIIAQLQICIAVWNTYVFWSFLNVFVFAKLSFFFSVLAEDAIKAALSDYKLKQDKNRTEDKESVQA